MYQTTFDQRDIDQLSFANQKLAAFDHTEYEYQNSEIGSVDLSKVIGVQHCNYQERMWGELIPQNDAPHHLLDRTERGLKDLSNTPEYYLSRDEKLHWSFAEVNGRYYVMSGVHRTIIGRAFLEANNLSNEVHGVHISHYQPKKMKDITTYEDEPPVHWLKQLANNHHVQMTALVGLIYLLAIKLI